MATHLLSLAPPQTPPHESLHQLHLCHIAVLSLKHTYLSLSEQATEQEGEARVKSQCPMITREHTGRTLTGVAEAAGNMRGNIEIADSVQAGAQNRMLR